MNVKLDYIFEKSKIFVDFFQPICKDFLKIGSAICCLCRPFFRRYHPEAFKRYFFIVPLTGKVLIKRGSKVRVVKMDTAGGMDWQAKRLEGKIFTVRFIDSAEQIHIEETGIALIPGVDEYSFFFSAD